MRKKLFKVRSTRFYVPSDVPSDLEGLCSTGVKSRAGLDDRQKSRLQSSSFLAWKEHYKILVLSIHYWQWMQK